MENKIVLNDKTLSWFLAIMIVSNVSIFSFNLEALYYIILFSCLIITIHQSKIYCINFSILLLYAVCALSILVNNVPYFFKSWERLVSFIFITAFISPLFFSYFINRIRIRLFHYSQSLLQILVISSFILNCLVFNLTFR